jgi:signal transduction histidine kinase
MATRSIDDPVARHARAPTVVSLESVHQVESLARAPGDVLLSSPQLTCDELVQMADELAQLAGYLAQLSAARSQFLSKAAHELRTPLTIARGWMSMLRNGELRSEQERVVKVVEQQMDDLTCLVSDLLDLSRRDAGALELHLEPLDLVALIEQVAEHQRAVTAPQGVQILVRRGIAQAYACVDRGRIAQVLNNLIGNACRYVPRHGDGRIEMIVAASKTAVQLSVRDNGIGISPEHLPRIFEPFYQIAGRKRGKSGLGLAVAHELVCAHGGSLTVESALGEGTTFHIWLRRIAGPTDAHESPLEASDE